MSKTPLIFTSLFLAFGVWVYGFQHFANHITSQSNISKQQKTDAIIVLTGGSDRLDTGLKLLDQGLAQRLFVSGVGPQTALNHMLSKSKNLPKNITQIKPYIDLGYQAKNTKGNAAESASWMSHHGFSSLRLVTADYHMPRSVYEFKKAMPDITIIANPVFPKDFQRNNWLRDVASAKIILLEYHKYLYSRLQ